MLICNKVSAAKARYSHTSGEYPSQLYNNTQINKLINVQSVFNAFCTTDECMSTFLMSRLVAKLNLILILIMNNQIMSLWGGDTFQTLLFILV